MTGVTRVALKNDVSLAVGEWPGPAKGPAIVCIHGLTANHTCWASVADVLSPAHRLIAYDLRGRGGSDKPEHGYSLVHHNEDLLGLLPVDLRTPLDVVRVTSGFGMRKHPILGYSKMHKGVDFAASTGTPILASGGGTVEFAGKYKGYGNFIKIRHNSQYQTAYGHLSRFAKGLSKGDKVKQGQVIGYVGATGLATGPHLHYEFRINDVHQNPLRVVIPAAPPLSAALKPAFEAEIESLVQQLKLLRSTHLARLD